MTDLEFIIVNSKEPRSQAMLSELQNRVSFNVYQESEDEPVWSVLEGGKDDMYIYDRCGKLTYYVPFPLSIIIDEQPIVATAVLATYFRSPCGTICEKNSSVNEFMNAIEFEANLTQTTEDTAYFTTESNSTYSDYDIINGSVNLAHSNETFPEVKNIDETQNEFIGNESLQTPDIDYIDNNEMTEYYGNSTNDQIYNTTTEYGLNDTTEHAYNKTTEYHIDVATSEIYSETTVVDVTNGTSAMGKTNFLTRLFNYFYKQSETKNSSENTPKENSMNHSDHGILGNYSDDNKVGQYQTDPPKDVLSQTSNCTTVPKENDSTVTPDRCAEADVLVCEGWSKKKLLNAQNCCSSYMMEDNTANGQDSCRNFGKKRCKKIQTILKCCIKTALSENVAGEISDTDGRITEEGNGVVCCKDVPDGKLCYVSETSVCAEGESVMDDTTRPECKTVP